MCAWRHLSWACVCMHMDMCLRVHVCHEGGFHMNARVLHIVAIVRDLVFIPPSVALGSLSGQGKIDSTQKAASLHGKGKGRGKSGGTAKVGLTASRHQIVASRATVTTAGTLYSNTKHRWIRTKGRHFIVGLGPMGLDGLGYMEQLGNHPVCGVGPGFAFSQAHARLLRLAPCCPQRKQVSLRKI